MFPATRRQTSFPIQLRASLPRLRPTCLNRNLKTPRNKIPYYLSSADSIASKNQGPLTGGDLNGQQINATPVPRQKLNTSIRHHIHLNYDENLDLSNCLLAVTKIIQWGDETAGRSSQGSYIINLHNGFFWDDYTLLLLVKLSSG